MGKSSFSFKFIFPYIHIYFFVFISKFAFYYEQPDIVFEKVVHEIHTAVIFVSADYPQNVEI